jgi:hypothetical protein
MCKREPASAPSGFADFRQHVLADVALQARLRAISDLESFVALALRLGRESGFSFAAEDVAAELKRGQTAWLNTWSPIL